MRLGDILVPDRQSLRQPQRVRDAERGIGIAGVVKLGIVGFDERRDVAGRIPTKHAANLLARGAPRAKVGEPQALRQADRGDEQIGVCIGLRCQVRVDLDGH